MKALRLNQHSLAAACEIKNISWKTPKYCVKWRGINVGVQIEQHFSYHTSSSEACRLYMTWRQCITDFPSLFCTLDENRHKTGCWLGVNAGCPANKLYWEVNSYWWLKPSAGQDQRLSRKITRGLRFFPFFFSFALTSPCWQQETENDLRWELSILSWILWKGSELPPLRCKKLPELWPCAW